MADKISLEEVATQRGVMLRFIEYLIAHHASENIQFWLEAQIFKYEKDQAKCKVEAERIYAKYFGPKGTGLNVEEDHLLYELGQKVKRPDRTIFMLVQNAIWGLLKLECFPRFRSQEGLEDKIKKKNLKGLLKHDKGSVLIQLYDTFIDLNTKFPTTENEIFRATVLPNGAYQEHLHTTLPDVDELWKDRDLMLAFREYLYQQYAHENLSFYLEVGNFENLTDSTEIEQRAPEIFDKFIGPNATTPVNLDFVVVEKLKKQLKKPTNQTFAFVKDKIWKVLTNEWFPDFVVSDLYRACNDETIQYVKSDGGRNRSRTITEYEKFCSGVAGNSTAKAKND